MFLNVNNAEELEQSFNFNGVVAIVMLNSLHHETERCQKAVPTFSFFTSGYWGKKRLRCIMLKLLFLTILYFLQYHSLETCL